METMGKRRHLVFFHRTHHVAAEEILKSGFTDSTGNFMTDTELTGVWLSEVPDLYQGPDEGVLLSVSMRLTEEELDYYEVKEDGKPYREWLFPASMLNTRGKVSLVPESSSP